MASVEEIIRQGRVAYRGIPWDAKSRKKGPTRVFETRSAALSYGQAWEQEQDGIAEDFGVPVRRNRKHVLFSVYAMQVAVRARGTKNSQRGWISKANIVGSRFAKLNVDEIDRAMVNEYLFDMTKKGQAPGTQRATLGFIRKVMKEAIMDKLIDDDPTRDVATPMRENIRTPASVTEADLAAMLAHFADWFHPAILLAHDSGLRDAEICGLRWFRLDLLRGSVEVKDVIEKDYTLRPFPKGKKSRTVPLSARTIAALRKHQLKYGGQGMQFVVRRPGIDKPMNPHNLSSLWYREMKKCAAVASPKPVFHDLRHACAHRLVAAGIQMPVLQAFMGHASLATTQIYMPQVTLDQMISAVGATETARPHLVAVQ